MLIARRTAATRAASDAAEPWQVQEELAAEGLAPFDITYAADWHLAPGVLDAVADRIAVARATLPDAVRDRARLVFTAHSIPTSMPAADRYVMQLRDSAASVAALVHARDWALVFQSRSGRPDPWLEPDVNDYLRDARAKGLEAAILVPIGFLADHVEVLYDLDVEARATADEIGLALARAEAVNDHPRFIEALADVVSEAVARHRVTRCRFCRRSRRRSASRRQSDRRRRRSVRRLTRDGRRSAVLVERRDEVVGDRFGRAAFDLVALHHVDELAALEDADRRGRRRVAGEVAARAVRRSRVGTCEDRRRDVRRDRVVEGEGDAGPGLAGGATAHRVHDDHERSRRPLDGLVDRLGCPEFLDTQAGQFLAHGRHEIFVGTCCSPCRVAALSDPSLP